jgi:hypothetical protein
MAPYAGQPIERIKQIPRYPLMIDLLYLLNPLTYSCTGQRIEQVAQIPLNPLNPLM